MNRTPKCSNFQLVKISPVPCECRLRETLILVKHKFKTFHMKMKFCLLENKKVAWYQRRLHYWNHYFELTVMQIITPCVATKLKVCYLLQMLFFVFFNSLLAKNVFVILINCYIIVHVFGIFSFIWQNIFTIKLGKLWTPEIFLECYCVAR